MSRDEEIKNSGIQCLDFYGKFLEHFDSLKAASDKLQITEQDIIIAIKTGICIEGKYRFFIDG